MPIQAEAWNRQVLDTFSTAVRRARLAARYRGIRVQRIRCLAYAPEVERGVVHLHVVWGWTGSVKPSDARWFISRVKREWVRLGGGKQCKAGRVSHGQAVPLATYLGKYLGKSNLEALDVIPRGKRPVYVSRVLTRETGITMRFLRNSRRAWRQWGVTDYALLVRFFRWADEHGVDPWTWHALPERPKPPPPEPWVPIEPATCDGSVQDYAQLHLAFA